MTSNDYASQAKPATNPTTQTPSVPSNPSSPVYTTPSHEARNPSKKNTVPLRLGTRLANNKSYTSHEQQRKRRKNIKRRNTADAALKMKTRSRSRQRVQQQSDDNDHDDDVSSRHHHWWNSTFFHDDFLMGCLAHFIGYSRLVIDAGAIASEVMLLFSIFLVLSIWVVTSLSSVACWLFSGRDESKTTTTRTKKAKPRVKENRTDRKKKPRYKRKSKCQEMIRGFLSQSGRRVFKEMLFKSSKKLNQANKDFDRNFKKKQCPKMSSQTSSSSSLPSWSSNVMSWIYSWMAYWWPSRQHESSQLPVTSSPQDTTDTGKEEKESSSLPLSTSSADTTTREEEESSSSSPESKLSYDFVLEDFFPMLFITMRYRVYIPMMKILSKLPFWALVSIPALLLKLSSAGGNTANVYITFASFATLFQAATVWSAGCIRIGKMGIYFVPIILCCIIVGASANSGDDLGLDLEFTVDAVAGVAAVTEIVSRAVAGDRKGKRKRSSLADKSNLKGDDDNDGEESKEQSVPAKSSSNRSKRRRKKDKSSQPSPPPPPPQPRELNENEAKALLLSSFLVNATDGVCDKKQSQRWRNYGVALMNAMRDESLPIDVFIHYYGLLTKLFELGHYSDEDVIGHRKIIDLLRKKRVKDAANSNEFLQVLLQCNIAAGIVNDAKKLVDGNNNGGVNTNARQLEVILRGFSQLFKISDPDKFEKEYIKSRYKLGKFLTKATGRTINLGQSLDKNDVLICMMNYAPPSSLGCVGTDDYDVMNKDNGCITLLLRSIATALIRKAKGNGRAPSDGAKGITVLDRIWWVTRTNKNTYTKEIDEVCKGLGISQDRMHLIGVILLACKVHFAHCNNKIPTILGTGAPVRKKVFATSDTTIFERTTFGGSIPHPECMVGSSI